ncbi:hypothetical protein [Gordonia humi]|uniref:Uncharacterized protein n=1 Tax=Gordonia humi TaxID=686429 RepID=A0A840F374_9ACTN|nr:hypothetical protein [Gordonia humi]MBB4136918.1 hypothetical protein [Gordonia humi]
MPDDARDTRAGDAPGGDPVQELLLGFASTIDQLAALIGGGHSAAAAAVLPGPVPDLLGELGTMLSDLGDLLARILTAFIAVLEAIVEVLRSAPADTTRPGTAFESIPVRIG